LVSLHSHESWLEDDEENDVPLLCTLISPGIIGKFDNLKVYKRELSTQTLLAVSGEHQKSTHRSPTCYCRPGNITPRRVAK
jgi:hypothetical protein